MSICSRNFESTSDLTAMRSMLMEARNLTSDWKVAHVGELQWNFFMTAVHLNARRYIRLWHAGEKLVGFTIIGEDPSFDFQIHPDYEWQGIEENCIHWAEEMIADLQFSNQQTIGNPIISGARSDAKQRIDFLQGHGFAPGGDFSEVNMMIQLDKLLPAAVMPAGCELHSMDEGYDVCARAKVQHDVWLPWSVADVKPEDYRYFMSLPGYDPELDLITVTPEGTIVSYVNGWLDPVNLIGDQGPVGALPAYRRMGYTRALLLECLHRMQARGMERVCISTGVNNLPAQNLYQSIGFKIVNGYTEFIKRLDK